MNLSDLIHNTDDIVVDDFNPSWRNILPEHVVTEMSALGEQFLNIPEALGNSSFALFIPLLKGFESQSRTQFFVNPRNLQPKSRLHEYLRQHVLNELSIRGYVLEMIESLFVVHEGGALMVSIEFK